VPVEIIRDGLQAIADNGLGRVCHWIKAAARETGAQDATFFLLRDAEARNNCVNCELMSRPRSAATASEMQGDTADCRHNPALEVGYDFRVCNLGRVSLRMGLKNSEAARKSMSSEFSFGRGCSSNEETWL